MKQTAIILLLLSCYIVFPQNEPIQTDYFTSKIFGSFEQLPGYSISMYFVNDYEVKIVYNSPQCGNCGFLCQSNEYSVENNRLLLEYNTQYEQQSRNFVTLEYTLHKSSTSLYFEYYLVLENPEVLENTRSGMYIDELGELWNYSTPVPPGAVKNIQGTNAVVLQRYRAEITKGLTIRDAPNTNSNKYTFDFGMESGEFYDYIPPGIRTVTVLARTEEKVTIGEWTNYWYIIDIDFDPMDSIKINGTSIFNLPNKYYFWAFGEFIQFTGNTGDYQDHLNSRFDACE